MSNCSIVGHVADIRDAEFANLCERILCLLNASLARKGAWNYGVEKSSDTLAAHVAVDAPVAVLQEFHVRRLRIIQV